MHTEQFRAGVRKQFQTYLDLGTQIFPKEDTLIMDLHCHDYNSDVPDELWGRILRLPETWISTEDLLANLRSHNVNAFTITNHNNARSCWEQKSKGIDVLSGAEFTCHFSDMDFSAHVLAYGFTPEQESRMERLRANGYAFLDYTVEQNIPTVLPHPLYLYHEKKHLPMSVYEKLALMFERFEVLNGQRDVLQNLLVKEWLDSLNEEVLEGWGKKHGIPPNRWCREPYRKRHTGGSDDHYALFAGGVGTQFHVPGLAEKLKKHPSSEIALDAIRNADTRPYGTVAEDEKLSIAFLDYFSQVALNMEDPGLLRIFLHRGEMSDKLTCLAIGNAMMELRRHKYTMKFLNTFHDALHGRKPGFLTSLAVSKDYRPMIDDLADIAKVSQKGPEMHHEFMECIEHMFLKVNQLISSRLTEQLGSHLNSPEMKSLSIDQLISRFEIPSYFRQLSAPEPSRSKRMSTISLSSVMDQVSFPALFYVIMGGARFMSAKVLNHDRQTVNAFAKAIGKHEHPKRVLWLSDTLFDKNGVASVLQVTLKYVQEKDLPIDFLICSNDIKETDHLKVVSSLGSVTLDSFSDQKFQFPNLMDIHKIFHDGGYDRIVCSTEALMGVVALYLKQAFTVPAYFYMHTDWMDYVQRMTNLDTHSLDRIRRMLRALYRAYDGIFVLNTEHQEWLTSRAIGISKRKVFLTAHWTESGFSPKDQIDKDPSQPVLLFAGRISQEKGVLDLPEIVAQVKKRIPGVRMRIAGTGVSEPALKKAMPDAEYLGWVNHQALAEAYATADFLVLPSRFDTFGCVVLESMSCGVPVAAYNTKGPKDIIEHGTSGVLAETAQELGDAIADVLMDSDRNQAMKIGALKRSKAYDPEQIMTKMMTDLEML